MKIQKGSQTLPNNYLSIHSIYFISKKKNKKKRKTEKPNKLLILAGDTFQTSNFKLSKNRLVTISVFRTFCWQTFIFIINVSLYFENRKKDDKKLYSSFLLIINMTINDNKGYVSTYDESQR